MKIVYRLWKNKLQLILGSVKLIVFWEKNIYSCKNLNLQSSHKNNLCIGLCHEHSKPFIPSHIFVHGFWKEEDIWNFSQSEGTWQPYWIFKWKRSKGNGALRHFQKYFNYIVAVSFNWWRKLEYPEKTTDLPQVT